VLAKNITYIYFLKKDMLIGMVYAGGNLYGQKMEMKILLFD